MPKHQENYQRIKGCFSEDKQYTLENIKFKTCPGNKVSNQAKMYLDMYAMYQKGVLPYPGSLSDQPAKIFDVFNIIDSCRQRNIKEMQKKEERKARLKQPPRRK